MAETFRINGDAVASIVKAARDAAEKVNGGIAPELAARGATLGVATYLAQMAHMPTTRIGMAFDEFSGYRHDD